MLAPTVLFNRNQALLKLAQSQRNMAWILVDPTLGNLLQRNWVEVMKFFSAMPENDNQTRPFQQPKMLGHGLTCHDQMLAQFT